MSELPVRVKQTRRRQEQRTVFLLMAENGRTARCQYAVEKRPDKGLLAGMYQLPNVEGFLTEQEIRAAAEAWGMNCQISSAVNEMIGAASLVIALIMRYIAV